MSYIPPTFTPNVSIDGLVYEASTTIANGQTVSANIPMAGLILVGIILPAAFTGITMTFNVSDDGTNFYPAYNTSGTALSATVSTSRAVIFAPTDFIGFNYIQLVSGSSEGGTRTIKLVTRKLT